MTYAEGKQLKNKKQALNSVFSMGEIGKIESINAENKLTDHVNAEQRRNRYQQNYMKILNYDYQSQEWIERPAEAAKKSQRRLARKNINENYMAVTGNKVSGLSREEKKKRKFELESRRAVSNKVSLGMADFMGDFNWKNDDISEDMITVIKDFDISRLEYDSDMEFAENISQNMQVLQSADTLYERLNAGETVPGVKEYEKIDLIFKLERMKNMRTYFEDKARVMSSPYYVSMRDTDFTEKTYRNLENIKENERKPEGLRLYAQSVLRMKENKEKIQRQQMEYDYLKKRALSKKQDKEENKEKPFDIFGNVINRVGLDEVGRTLNYTKKKDGTIGINDYITLKTREWINNDLKSPISAEKFIITIDTVKNTILQYKKDHPEENDEASSLLEHMDKVRKAAISGRISPDVARLWLDRPLMGYKALGNRSYQIVEAQLKTAENKEYKPESSKVYKDNVNEMIINYAQSTNGLKTHLQSNSMVYYIKQDESSRAYTNVATKFFREFRNAIDGNKDFVHVKGKDYSSNNVLTRIYISANPECKSECLGHLMNTFKELKLQDKLYFKVSTDNAFPRVDDIVIYIQEGMDTEKVKEMLDVFHKKCEDARKGTENKPPILASDENGCVTAREYKKGISFAVNTEIPDLLNSIFSVKKTTGKNNNNKKEIKKNAKPVFPYCDYGRQNSLYETLKDNGSPIQNRFSYNTFIVDALYQSFMIANKRVGGSDTGEIDVKNKELLREANSIFSELCFLGGVDLYKLVDPKIESFFEKKA